VSEQPEQQQPQSPPKAPKQDIGLKVLHTCASLNGHGYQMLQIAQYATEHNHMSYVACADSYTNSNSANPYLEKLLRVGGMHIPSPFDTPGSALKAPVEGYKLAAHIKENGIDMIHAHDARTIHTALWASKFSGVPVVVSANTTETPNRTLRKSYGIVAPSLYMAKKVGLKGVHILPPSYDPVDLHNKNIDADAVDGLWAEWDVPTATSVILVTEPLREENGYRHLIEAFGLMKKIPFKAIICANYTEQQALFTDLWKRIEALGISKEVLFIDKPVDSNAMKNVLSACDVVVFPNSNPEAEAQSVVNAQAMGKAVVVHSPSNRAEVVDSGKTGWLVNLENPETAANKLSLVLKDATTDMTRLQKMGTTATRHCKEHYTTAAVCTELFAFYDQIRHAST